MQRKALNLEYQALIKEYGRIGDTTTFNNIKLLQAGKLQNPEQLSLQVGNASVARNSLDLTKKKIDELNLVRGNLGAMQSRLHTAANVLSIAQENTSQAESRIRDADIAEETSIYLQASIHQQTAASVLRQTTLQSDIALKLIKGT